MGGNQTLARMGARAQMKPSEIRAQEAAKKAAAGQGGDIAPSAAPKSSVSKPFSSPAKSWNDPKPQESDEDLGWTSSDDDSTPAPAVPAAKPKVVKPKPKAKAAPPAAPPAPAPAQNVSQAPAAPAQKQESAKPISVKDRIKNMEAAAPQSVEEPPKRMSVKDRIKQAEAAGAGGEDASRSSVGQMVTQAQGAHKAAKALSRTTKLAKDSAGMEELGVPSIFEGKFKKDDVEAYRKAFKEFDANGNGEIEQAELSNVLKKLGMPIQKSEVAEFISEFDLDKSGALSFGEFLQGWRKLSEAWLEAEPVRWSALFKKEWISKRYMEWEEGTTHTLKRRSVSLHHSSMYHWLEMQTVHISCQLISTEKIYFHLSMTASFPAKW